MKNCPKCGATSGNLIDNRDQSFSCRVCGNVNYNTPAAASSVVGGPKAKLCSGCEKNRVKSRKSKKGLCVQCRIKLNNWLCTDQQTPAPFIKVLGIWIKNRP